MKRFIIILVKQTFPAAVVFLFTAFVLLSFSGCKKQGVIGPQGVQGQAGKDGTNGKDGATILTGDDVPLPSAGENGDFFLDTAAIVLYGPKTDTGWGSGISLKGTPGTQILRGQGAPSPVAGNQGDYYYDQTNGKIYGPKNDEGWGDGFSTGIVLDPGKQDDNTDVKVYTFTDGLQWEGYGVIGKDDTANTYQIHQFVDAIDSTVLASAAVMAYVKISGGTWYQVPFWFNGLTYYWNFYIVKKGADKGRGLFSIFTPRGGSAAPEVFEAVKLVIIPGTSVPAANMRRSVHFNDYLRVARAMKR